MARTDAAGNRIGAIKFIRVDSSAIQAIGIGRRL